MVQNIARLMRELRYDAHGVLRANGTMELCARGVAEVRILEGALECRAESGEK